MRRVRAARVLAGTNREFASALAFLILLLAAFAAASPGIWLSGHIYAAVWVTVPQYSLLAVALVFVVACGEIDLSFASVVTLCSFIFADAASHGISVVVAMGLALLAGIGAELVAGAIIAYLGLSSFVVTLGLYYFWDGLVNVLSNGGGIGVQQFSNNGIVKIITGTFHGIPDETFWAIGFAAIAVTLLAKRPFGARVLIVGDNRQAAAEQGISVARVKLAAFGFVGLAAAAVGIMVALVNLNFYPGTGDGLLLPALAAVFIGGTSIVGGQGTVMGAFVGSITIGIIDTGIVTSGLSGFYTQLVFGILIVLSIAALRLSEGHLSRDLERVRNRWSRRLGHRGDPRDGASTLADTTDGVQASEVKDRAGVG